MKLTSNTVKKVVNTAGDILFSKFGFEVGKDKLSVGLTMLPINQNLSSGAIKQIIGGV
jgi:hypothetical protein